MNKGIVGLGVLILLFSLYPIFYNIVSSFQTPVAGRIPQNHAGGCPTTLTTVTASPYYYYGLIIALIGVVTAIIGSTIPKAE